MFLVDLDSDLEFIYYDDKEQCFKKKFGTLKEFLQTFADYKRLQVYTLTYGALNDEKK